MENKIERYFEKQVKEKKIISLRLRNIILSTFPGIKEEYKWGTVVYDDGRFYIAVVRQGINLGFAISGLTAEEKRSFEGRGKTMRHLKFVSVDEIDEVYIKTLLQLVKKKAILQPY